ncbi:MULTISPECIES: hypothetical protein [unclassified Pseudomonas]|uniref:hypothetical protein n=1 Tax=unclassified Pseudomonas TaxID=196821 RepID=UPI00200DEDE4|nr:MULTISPECIES: hypothetical protein [unclassified Pseudomonas]
MSINVNSTQISALLRLYPMAIPGAVENLQPPGAYHLGIPESIYSPSTKLFMVIDPVTLFSTPFAAGDSVRLWVNSLATSVIKPIKPGEENDRIFMEAPWGVLKDGLNTLYYEVTRVSGNKDQSNPILNVLFNNPIASVTVTHPASIVLGQPAVVTITVSYARPYDEVTLTIGTWSITFTNFDHTQPITYPLTAADLQQIGVGNHPVSAIIRDQLSNSNVSPTTYINISATAPDLTIDPTPMVLDGVKFFQNYGWASKVVQGNTAIRQAQGGTGTLVYKPDNPLLVAVTQSGEVSGLRKGTTTVRVSDQNGKEVSFDVTVSNTFDVIQSPQSYAADVNGKALAMQWIRNQGGILYAEFFAKVIGGDAINANFISALGDLFGGFTFGQPGGCRFCTADSNVDSGLQIAMDSQSQVTYTLVITGPTPYGATAIVPR